MYVNVYNDNSRQENSLILEAFGYMKKNFSLLMIFVAKYDRVINKSLSSRKVYYIRIKFFSESGMEIQVQVEKRTM